MTGLVVTAALPTAWSVFRRETEPATLLVCGVLCLAVGSAGVLWAMLRPGFDGVEQTGMALLMVLFVIEGALALWDSARRQKLHDERPATA